LYVIAIIETDAGCSKKSWGDVIYGKICGIPAKAEK